MSVFGWSLPPGCSSTPYEDEGPCIICGKFPENCECPECDVCGEIGNPECVGRHMLAERWPVDIRFCALCGMNDPESQHIQVRLSSPEGHVPICRGCWQEAENVEAQREQEESEVIEI